MFRENVVGHAMVEAYGAAVGRWKEVKKVSETGSRSGSRSKWTGWRRKEGRETLPFLALLLSF